MNIIDTKGKSRNEHKRQHDSERVMGVRTMLNNVMVKFREQWAADNAGDPTGATRPNEPSIDQHYINKWVEQCTAIMNSSDPVDVDPEAMAKWIAQQRAAKEHKENMAKPLHAILDLEPMGFKFLGLLRNTPVWVSTECALMCVPGGLVGIYLRPQGSDAPQFIAQDCMEGIQHFPPDICLPDYTLGELMDYLRAQRRQRPAHPAEVDMEAARKQLSPAQA